MKVWLDDQELRLDDEIMDGGKEAICEEVKRRVSGKNRVVSDIVVDGQSLGGEEEFLSLSGGLEVKFVTQHVRDLVIESLEEGRRYLAVLENGLREVATGFEEGNNGEAYNLFSQAVEGLNWLIGVFNRSSLLTGMEADNFKTGNYSEFTSELNGILDDIISAIEDNRYPKIAFMIRNNLLPILETLRRYWNEVSEHLGQPIQ